MRIRAVDEDEDVRKDEAVDARDKDGRVGGAMVFFLVCCPEEGELAGRFLGAT